jgi:hypothetical protein
MATKKVNIDIVARDKSRQALHKVRGNLDGVKQSVFNLRNALVGLGAGLIVKSFIDVGKQVESLQVRLKFLFGSVEEGAKAFDEMAKFAGEVPFSLGEIQKGAGVLAVVSDDAEELAKNMRLTGNVAAVTGLDFKTTAEQIQRSLSAGISAADLFRDRGVKSMLGFSAGSKVSIEETAEALTRVFGAGGEFDGATKALANTLEGTLSMIGDKYFNFQKTVAEEFFVGLKQEFGALDDALADNEKMIQKFASSIGVGLSNAVSATAKGFKLVYDNMVLIKKVGMALIVFGMTKAFIGLALAIRRAGLAMIAFTKVSMKNLAGLLAAGAVLLADYTGHLDKLLEKFTAKKTMEEFSEEVEIVAGSLRLLESATSDLGGPFMKLQDEALILIGHLEEMRKGVAEDSMEFENLTYMIDELKAAIHGVPLPLIVFGLEEVTDKTEKATTMFGSFLKGFKEAMDVDIFEQFEKIGEKTFKSLTKMLTDFVETGKMNFQDFARSVTRMIVEALIGKAVKYAIDQAVIMWKASALREAMMSVYAGALKTFASIPWPWNMVAVAGAIATGMKLVNKIKGFEQGGRPPINQPSMVGEKGPELFIPDRAGTIVPNHQLGGKPVTVNFNINTVDARGFNELLVNSRGVIVNMINSAVNEKGRMAIV